MSGSRAIVRSPISPAVSALRVTPTEDAEHVVLAGGQVGLGLEEALPRRQHPRRDHPDAEHRLLLRGGERPPLLDLLTDAGWHGGILHVETNIVKTGISGAGFLVGRAIRW